MREKGCLDVGRRSLYNQLLDDVGLYTANVVCVYACIKQSLVLYAREHQLKLEFLYFTMV